MKTNLIFYTIFCIVIINSDIVLSQQVSNLSKIEKRGIKNEINNNDNIAKAIRMNDFIPQTEFADSVFIYTPEIFPNIGNVGAEKYFGYDFFTTSLNRSIWNNQPPPSEYILGVGDEVIIEIWGDTQLRINHVIDQYGKIYVDKIGQMSVVGSTLKDIKSKLLNKFQNVYSSLKGEQPTAILDVSMGKLKSINVTLLGEAAVPGIHTIHPFSTIITGILQTGGVLETGSLRNIQLIRNGDILTGLDFYQYLLNGNANNDFRLLDGDIIFIPVRHSTILIEGEVVHNALFELLANETLQDIIQYAGGIKISSQQYMRINRRYNTGNHDLSRPDNDTFIIDYLTDKEFVIQDGDEIMVYQHSLSQNEVFIYGQVKKPGRYSFNTTKDMFLLDLMKFAGGLYDPTYLKTVYLERGEIIRSHPNSDYPQILTFNVKDIITGENTEKIILENWDIVLIRQNPKFKSPRKVSIMGEVKVPGIYALQKKWETLSDILIRSGGFTNQAFHDGIQMFRNEEQIVLQDFDIVLLDGDSLQVPEHPGIVRVIGAVNRPGLVQYYKKKSLSNYIDNAGGLSPDADKYNITIVYANGDVKINKRLFNPKVGEGATIIVQMKELEEPLNMTEYATNIASLITSFVTLYLLTK